MARFFCEKRKARDGLPFSVLLVLAELAFHNLGHNDQCDAENDATNDRRCNRANDGLSRHFKSPLVGFIIVLVFSAICRENTR